MSVNFFEETLIKNDKLPEEWRNQDSLDELSAFLQANWEQRFAFYKDNEYSSKQQFLTFGGQKSIRLNNYIGTIVFRGKQLNIFPKIFRYNHYDYDTSELSLKHLMNNLTHWLEYCNRFNYPYINITTGLEDSENLRDLFLTLFVRYTKAAIDRGLFYRYENKEEDCTSVKGRINYRNYFCRKIPRGEGYKFKCNYSEFEFDNQINRIIKYTCKSIFTSVSDTNQKILRNILMKMNEVADQKYAPHDCERIRLSKMQDNYKMILSMCKIILLNKSATYTLDQTESFCFLFPTELLFEGFVGGFMQSALSDEGRVRLQASEMTLVDNIVYAGESLGKAFTMRHDILVEHKEKGLFILDTKYKMLDRLEESDDVKSILNTQVGQTDLYQVYHYALKRGVSKAYLLYPMFRCEDPEPEIPIMKYAFPIDGVLRNIDIYIVRLPFVFEEDADKVKKNLIKVLNQIWG